MASIEVIIRDDQGNIISQGNAKEIALRHANLETIEAGVEAWRKQVLPEIESQLLQQTQSEFTLEKKTSWGGAAMALALLRSKPCMGNLSSSCRSMILMA